MTKRNTANRILRRKRTMCPALIVLFLILSASAFAQSAQFPMLEDYLPTGKVTEYIDAASKYLQQHPSSRFAPRVAFDLLMVSEGTSNKTLADTMRALLLFEHGRSIQAFYVVAGFKEAKDLRDFLKNQAKIKLEDDPGSLSPQFTQAVAVGLDHFKEKLLEDGDFLLQAYALADIVGAERISQIILPALRRECAANEDLSLVFNIFQDNTLNTVEKIIKLHDRKKGADFLEQFYLTTLTSAQKMHPPILKIGAENAIRSKEYETAQTLIGSMPNDMQNDPQIRFWKGWSLFALQKDRQAIDTFDQLIKIQQNNNWATPANIFSQGIRNYAQWQQLNAKAILAATKVFQEGVGVLEAIFSYHQVTKTGPKQTYMIYVGVVPDENHLEFSISKADRIFLGYKTTDTDSALYLEGEPKILTFRERGLIPTPNLALDRNSDGTFSFQAGVEMASSIKQAAAGSSGLFNSPYLSTPEGIQGLLDYVARRKGWIPAKPLVSNGTHIFIWKIPATDTPAMKQVEYHISRQHLITAARYEQWSIQDLRYAPTKSFRLKPPPWPDHPVSVNQGFDFSALLKVFSSAMGVFIEKP